MKYSYILSFYYSLRVFLAYCSDATLQEHYIPDTNGPMNESAIAITKRILGKIIARYSSDGNLLLEEVESR